MDHLFARRQQFTEEIMHLIQAYNSDNPTMRRVKSDAALEKLVDAILSTCVVGINETDAVEAYEAGAHAIGRVLQRIIRET
jgi:hypothetical protein